MNVRRIRFLAVVALLALLAPVAPHSAAAPTAAPTQAIDAASPWACTPPVIDGQAPFYEWGAAPFLDVRHGRIYFMNDGTHLYFLFDVVGDTVDDPPAPPPTNGDYFWLSFDINLNAAIDPGVDVNYAIAPSLPYQIGLQYYEGPGTWTGLNPTAAPLGVGMQASFASQAPHRIWELAIPLREIGAGPGAVVSAGFRLYSQNPAFTDDLPPDFFNDFSDLIQIALSETGCQVGMEKSVSAHIANPGDILNYRIDYFLPGGVYKNLTIYEALPPGLVYLPGSANPPAIFSGGVLIWKLGDVSASGSVTFQAMVDHSACREQEVIVDIANLSASEPHLLQISNPATTEITCRPIEFPTDDPPYAESEITVNPYPLVRGQPTMLCTTIANTSAMTQTVRVNFELANFGIGLPFTPIVAPGNPREVEIPPGGSVTVCIQWVPTTPGHQCIQVVVSDVHDQFPPIRSQRNLDVNEVLLPGEPSTFQIPVGNPSPDPMNVRMLVRNNCPDWMVEVDPISFTLPSDAHQTVYVKVMPPDTAILGSGCAIDIEAWEVDQAGNLTQLIGGIRKLDEPLIPLGDPGERPFAEKEIRIAPYPVISGKAAEVCVVLENDTDTGQDVMVEFLMSGLGIGLPFNRIVTTGAANPQMVHLPPHSTVVVCVQFVPTSPGHRCLAVKLSMANGYVTHSYRNLDVAELLEPGVPEEVPISVANPTAAMADMDLVVDNTCLGWTAWVSPSVLLDVGPNSADVRTAVLTVIPPAGLLGTNCYIDLLAYIDGRLIGGIRKIDRMPTAPPIDEPPWAEREITVSPDPPVAGMPAQMCVQFTNPTAVDQPIQYWFAEADFGAGIPFTNFAFSLASSIPAHGTLTACAPWTPAATGTLHRCLRVQIHQDGYEDVFSQRNVDLIHLDLGRLRIPDLYVDLPPFLLRNPNPDPVPIFFHLLPVGLVGLDFQVMGATQNGAFATQNEWMLGPEEIKEFFVRVESTGDAGLVGDQNYLDVLPYANGQALLVEGIQSGMRYMVEPWRLYLPVVLKAD